MTRYAWIQVDFVSSIHKTQTTEKKIMNLMHRNNLYNFSNSFPSDEVAEWLRRWTANPMCSARVGSSPILVENCFSNIFYFY